MVSKVRISPLGESALLVEFGDVISEELNLRALRLAEYIDHDPFPGFIEAAPAYASTAIFYHLPTVRRSFTAFDSAFDAVRSIAEEALLIVHQGESGYSQTVEIPVDFGNDSALDLDLAAEITALSKRAIIEMFTSRVYRVYMLGFLPGFAYMGEVDERIALPRKQNPRTRVPKGSVGIAGRQTGIYPSESPGGWQILGRTNAEMFDPESEEPCLLRPGDLVKFFAV